MTRIKISSRLVCITARMNCKTAPSCPKHFFHKISQNPHQKSTQKSTKQLKNSPKHFSDAWNRTGAKFPAGWFFFIEKEL